MDIIKPEGKPKFLDKSKVLLEKIRDLTYDEKKKLWKTSDRLSQLNDKRFREMDFNRNLTPAIFSYDGNQYKRIGPLAFDDGELRYLQDHLRILSAFYGILRPLDGIRPYRLDLNDKLDLGDYNSLYDFWQDMVYEDLVGGDRVIINLASKEYERLVRPYLKGEDRFITIIFGKLHGEKIRQSSRGAKSARGEMVRFMAEKKIRDLDEIKAFNGLGYSFNGDLSTDDEYIFLKD